jgi:hypothetical protein
MPFPIVPIAVAAGVRVAGGVIAKQFAKETVKKGTTEAAKRAARAAAAEALRRSGGNDKPPTGTNWQKFDPKGGTKPTPDYLRPRNGAPDAALPPKVSTPTKPTPTKPDLDPLGPNTKPFNPYSPKTDPWPDMPKVNPNAPKPAPAPRKPVTPPAKAPTKAPTKTPTTSSPWSPKSSTPPKIEIPKSKTITSPTTQTQTALQRITNIPGGVRTVAFGTGLAGAAMFMPKAAPKDDDKNWYPSAIV